MRSDYVLRRRVRNEYLVRERDRKRLLDLGLLLLAVAPVGLALFVYTSVHLQVLEVGYRITDLESNLENLAETERRLRLQASRLSSPARVAELAQRDLGLATPELPQLVFVQASGGGS